MIEALKALNSCAVTSGEPWLVLRDNGTRTEVIESQRAEGGAANAVRILQDHHDKIGGEFVRYFYASRDSVAIKERPTT